jgi:hypothetical protein
MPEKLSPDAQRIIGSASGTIVRGAMKPADVVAEGVAHALQLAGDDLRLTTATSDQLTVAAAFLAKARGAFSDSVRDSRRFEAVERLEVAGKAIGAEMRRRAFTPLAIDG